MYLYHVFTYAKLKKQFFLMDKVRILILRFSSIGDIILTTPVIRNLKSQVDNVEIHFATKKQFASIVLNNPYVDKVHSLDKSFDELKNSLNKYQFDYIIDLHKNLRTLRVKNALKVTALSFEKLNLKKWFLVQFKMNKMPDVHIVDRYMDTIRFFVDENDNKGLDYFFSDNFKKGYLLPQTHHKGYTVAVIGANHYTKQIPSSILINILNKHNKPVVLVGGKKEKRVADEITKRLKVDYIDLCGVTTLDESANIIKESRCVLTPDTGMMHIAAAFKRPIVCMWGNTVPEFGMYPYMPKNKDLYYISEVENLKCRPCSKIGYAKCPKKHFNCMMQQNIEQIVGKLNEYFNL